MKVGDKLNPQRSYRKGFALETDFQHVSSRKFRQEYHQKTRCEA